MLDNTLFPQPYLKGSTTIPNTAVSQYPKLFDFNDQGTSSNTCILNQNFQSTTPKEESLSPEFSKACSSDVFPRRSSHSAWSKWSQDRRSLSNRGAGTSSALLSSGASGTMVSARTSGTGKEQRIATLFDQLTNVQRTPTPIMKAREESKYLVAPEIANSYLPPMEELLSSLHRKASSAALVRTGHHHHRRGAISCQTVSSTTKLSYNEIQLLHDYWDHHNFVLARKWGLCSGLFSMGLHLFSLASSRWSFYGDRKSPDNAGLWLRCISKNNTCDFILHSLSIFPSWLKAVIFLFILGSLCSILATFFSFGGVFKKHLPKKLYFYHSGAEFYCVSGLCSGSSLLIYSLFCKEHSQHYQQQPVQLWSKQARSSYLLMGPGGPEWLRFGHAFSLGWLSVLLALTGFSLLKLDEFIQQLSRLPGHWRYLLRRLASSRSLAAAAVLRRARDSTVQQSPSGAMEWRQLAVLTEWR